MKKKHKSNRLVSILTLGLILLTTGLLCTPTCASPITLTLNGCNSNVSTSDTAVWFSFNSGSSVNTCHIQVTSPWGISSSMPVAQLYTGSCGTLTSVASGHRDMEVLLLEAAISPSTNYLVRVARTSTTSIQFDICTYAFTTASTCPCASGNCQLVCNPTVEQNIGPPPGLNFMWGCKWQKAGSTNAGTPDFFND